MPENKQEINDVTKWTRLLRDDTNGDGILAPDELSSNFSKSQCKDPIRSIALQLFYNEIANLVNDGWGVSQADLTKLSLSLQHRQTVEEQGALAERYTAAVFDYLDENGDNLLDRNELKQRILDRKLANRLVPVHQLLQRNFSQILNHKPWWSMRQGISPDDVAAYVKDLRSVDTTEVRLADKVHRVFRDVRAFPDHQPLWGSSLPQAGAIKQGLLKDCYFLAALSSLSNCRPKDIQAMIRQGQSFAVSFPGHPAFEIPVGRPNLYEALSFARPGPNGIWTTVLDMAFARIETGPSNLAQGGNIERGITILTGHPCKTYTFGNTGLIYRKSGWLGSVDEVASNLTTAIRNNRVVVGAIIDKTTQNLESRHAYSVLNFDNRTRMVTVRNPRGAGEPVNKWGSARDGRDDGVFKISLSEFIKTFDQLSIEM